MRYALLIVLLFCSLLLSGCDNDSEIKRQKAYDAGWVHVSNMEVISTTSELSGNGKYKTDKYFVTFKRNGALYRLIAKDQNTVKCLVSGGIYELDYHNADMVIGSIKILE